MLHNVTVHAADFKQFTLIPIGKLMIILRHLKDISMSATIACTIFVIKSFKPLHV